MAQDSTYWLSGAKALRRSTGRYEYGYKKQLQYQIVQPPLETPQLWKASPAPDTYAMIRMPFYTLLTSSWRDIKAPVHTSQPQLVVILACKLSHSFRNSANSWSWWTLISHIFLHKIRFALIVQSSTWPARSSARASSSHFSRQF